MLEGKVSQDSVRPYASIHSSFAALYVPKYASQFVPEESNGGLSAEAHAAPILYTLRLLLAALEVAGLQGSCSPLNTSRAAADRFGLAVLVAWALEVAAALAQTAAVSMPWSPNWARQQNLQRSLL